MLASINTFSHDLKFPVGLIFVSLFLFAFNSTAQNKPEQEHRVEPTLTQSDASQEAANERRIGRLGEISLDEWEMDLALPVAQGGVSSGSVNFTVLESAQYQKLQQLLSSLGANPENTTTLAQLNGLLTEILGQANSLTDAGSFERAAELLAVVRAIEPELEGLKAAQKRRLGLSQVGGLQSAANTALESQRYVAPANNNALYYFNQVLLRDPPNELAQQGLEQLQLTLVQRALDSAGELDFEMADEWLAKAATISEQQKRVEDGRAEVVKIRLERASELQRSAIESMDSGDFARAEFIIIDLIALGGQEHQVKSLQARLEETRYYSGFVPGQVFADSFLTSKNDKAPEMVIIAAGSFLMGSTEQDENTRPHEKPQHRVNIKRGFALGVREVSVGEFRLFVERSGYQTAADHAGSSTIYDETGGRLNRRLRANWEYDYQGGKADSKLPVLHVNWHDAKAYVAWLKLETGKSYRLPTEAEYEFVARAGTNGTYWWGEGSPPGVVENLTGDRDISPSQRSWSTAFRRYGDAHWGPAPTGSYTDDEYSHPMGVHDIAGNVSEWVEDCWHQNFIHAPSDGSAWVNPGCKRVVVKGGYWASAPAQSRAAFRISAKPETFGPIVGIRIARNL